ncbi:MAG: acetylxylan esterase [Specibacter sp.]
MPRTDLPLHELVNYRPAVAAPADFDAFWAGTLAETAAFDLALTSTPVSTVYSTIAVWDVSFAGFGGDRINAWLTVPVHSDGELPAVVEFIGYGGGRGFAGQQQHWAAAGYAHLLVDTRGQGANQGDGGATADPHGSGPAVSGFTTRGIEDRNSYYFRRVFADGVRAVEAARSLSQVDAGRVAVQGGSQGGAIALAVSGLVPDLLASMPDVPFLCHIERAVDIGSRDPIIEITKYLAVHRGAVDRVFETLSAFDGVNFAKRATAPSLFSVGLMDPTCPPSTVFAAYNHHAAHQKDIAVYRFNGHEGGGWTQRIRQTEWLNAILDRDADVNRHPPTVNMNQLGS